MCILMNLLNLFQYFIDIIPYMLDVGKVTRDICKIYVS